MRMSAAKCTNPGPFLPDEHRRPPDERLQGEDKGARFSGLPATPFLSVAVTAHVSLSLDKGKSETPGRGKLNLVMEA